MKHIDLDVDCCWDCPFMAIARLYYQSEPDYGFYYCQKHKQQANESRVPALKAIASSELTNLEQIPDWCPLPDSV